MFSAQIFSITLLSTELFFFLSSFLFFFSFFSHIFFLRIHSSFIACMWSPFMPCEMSNIFYTFSMHTKRYQLRHKSDFLHLPLQRESQTLQLVSVLSTTKDYKVLHSPFQNRIQKLHLTSKSRLLRIVKLSKQPNACSSFFSLLSSFLRFCSFT